MSKLSDHLAVLLIHAAVGDQKMSTFIDQLGPELENKFGLQISDELVNQAVGKLVASGAARMVSSDLAGTLIAIRPENVLDCFGPDARDPSETTPIEYDERYNKVRRELDILEGYAYGGERWIERVVLRMQSGEFEGLESNAATRDIVVPASDRIVSLSDNQRSEIDELAKQLEKEVSRENSIDGDIALRSRFIAQISASRELIRGHSVRVYLLYETLVRMLGTLILRYEGQAIGQTAKKLLDLLIDHVFGK